MGKNKGITPSSVTSNTVILDADTAENDSTERLEEDVTEQTTSINEQNSANDGMSLKDKIESRKGLTSEERVLLREKKRQRLAKEQETADTKTSTSTSSQERASHPNPFDDDDDNDEEEGVINQMNHQNDNEQTKCDADESRPNSADSEGEDG